MLSFVETIPYTWKVLGRKVSLLQIEDVMFEKFRSLWSTLGNLQIFCGKTFAVVIKMRKQQNFFLPVNFSILTCCLLESFAEQENLTRVMLLQIYWKYA